MFAGSDREATLIKVIVEPGPERLALAIFGEDERIYEIEDPNGRLARVLLIMSGRTQAGVAGLPRDSVHLIDFSGCALDHRRTIRRATGQSPKVHSDAPRVLAPVFDHVPEVIVLDSAERVFVPSGERREIIEGEPHGTTIVTDSEKSTSYRVQRVEIGPNGQWIKKPIETYAKSEVNSRMRDLLAEYPGGVRRVDPATVVSRVPVAPSPNIPAADR